MKEPKYIENVNLPFRLNWQEHPEFCITKFEKVKENYILYYSIEGRGTSLHFTNKEKFDVFPNNFEVQSGGWYGESGRWSPTTRCSGTLICEDVSSFNQISNRGVDFKFAITKPFFSSKKNLLIESEEIGVIVMKCKRIIPQEYDTIIYNKKKKEWVKRNKTNINN